MNNYRITWVKKKLDKLAFIYTLIVSIERKKKLKNISNMFFVFLFLFTYLLPGIINVVLIVYVKIIKDYLITDLRKCHVILTRVIITEKDGEVEVSNCQRTYKISISYVNTTSIEIYF